MNFDRTRELALIAAIRATPERDEPRLDYADYLEKVGHFRGRYVRLAVEAAREDLPEARREESRRQAAELWLQKSDAGTDGMMRNDLSLGQPGGVRLLPDGFWVPAVAAATGPFRPGDGARRVGLAVAIYRRGFVHRIAASLPPAASTRPLASVLGRAPVRILEVDPRTAAEVMPGPEASVVEELELDGVDRADALEGWAAAVLPRLRRLRLHGPAAADAWLRCGAAAPAGCLVEITGCELSSWALVELRLASPGVRVGDEASPGSVRPGAWARLRARAALAPDDDGPRLRLAGWVERFSPARASMIRSQLAGQRYTREIPDFDAFDQDAVIEASEGDPQAVKQGPAGWSVRVLDPEARGQKSYTATQVRRLIQVDYARGLPARLSLGARVGADAAASLLAVCPAPALATRPEQAAAILDAPPTDEGDAPAGPVRELELTLTASELEPLSALLRAPGARLLRRLRVAAPPDALPMLARALQGAGPLPALRAVELETLRITAATLTSLLDGRALPNLDALTLDQCALGPDELAALRRGEVRLALLQLGHPQRPRELPPAPLVDPDGLLAFADSLAASRLTSLRVAWAGLPAGFARKLASCTSLGSLEALSLAGNPLDDDDGRALLGGFWMPALRQLDLTGAPVGRAVVAALHGRQGLPKLERVGLEDTGLTEMQRDPSVVEYPVEREVHLSAEELNERYLAPLGLRAL